MRQPCVIDDKHTVFVRSPMGDGGGHRLQKGGPHLWGNLSVEKAGKAAHRRSAFLVLHSCDSAKAFERG